MVKKATKECFYPLAAIAFGIIIAVFIVLTLPNEWQKVWQGEWIPRSIALQTTVISWCFFTVWRGKNLKCGGTVDAEGSDNFRNSAINYSLLAGFLISLWGYWTVNELAFFIPWVITLIVAVSEVGWGDPFIMVKGRWT